jgi:hypothetical protein
LRESEKAAAAAAANTNQIERSEHFKASLERKTLLSGKKIRELRSGDGEVSLFGFWWQQTMRLAQTAEMVEDSWSQ